MKKYKLEFDENPSPQDVRFVIGNLIAFNDTRAEHEHYRSLTIFLRDIEGEIVGGLLGCTNWRWLFISHLWISENLRGGGYGQKLIAAAEHEAVKRGCKHAHVDTFSFQAPGFYEKLGYRVFGTLEDYPEGHSRIFLQKRNLGTEAK